MKITKTQEGITLLALIITIVVLLILAGVAINSIENTNLIDQTLAAGQKWNEAQENESTTLGSYESEIDKQLGKLPITFTIDGVKYTAKRGTKWWGWNDVAGSTWYCANGRVITEFTTDDELGYYGGTGRCVKGVSPSDTIENGKAYVTEEFRS